MKRTTKQASDIRINTYREVSKGSITRGGSVRQNLPVRGVLQSMADKILHERIVIKKKHSRENGWQARRLSNEQVREIRRRYNPRTRNFKELSKDFGVCESYIERIVYFHARTLA